MCPNFSILDGIFNGGIGLWEIMLCCGFIAAILVFNFYSKRLGMGAKAYSFYFYLALISMAGGLLSAMIFQSIYNAIESGVEGAWGGVTFLGGLVGGVGTFLLGILFFGNNDVRRDFNIIVQLFPPAVCAALFFGRLGCFFAGCCYGMETDSFLGMKFPGHEHKIIPTQLFESIFALLLFFVMVTPLKKFKYTENSMMKDSLIIFMFAYGLWRFLIEFVRDDPRGGVGGGYTFPSPSQVWCMLMIVGAGVLLYFRLKLKKPICDIIKYRLKAAPAAEPPVPPVDDSLPPADEPPQDAEPPAGEPTIETNDTISFSK